MRLIDTPFADRLRVAQAMINLTDRHRGPLCSELGIAWRDQHQAATAETMHNITQLPPLLRQAEPLYWQHSAISTELPTPAQEAMILAALMGCQPCAHLQPTGGRLPSPGPIIADLNHRLALCRRCCRTRRKPIDDGRCEICDADVPDRKFASFVIAHGTIMLIGDRGDCCADLIPSH